MSNPLPHRIDDHIINRDDLENHAVEIIHTLKGAGFEAYLVGGCVRDLLCHKKPKDFDVATNATPNEVRALFRRSRLIGRRFPIAHVRSGRELIEVSTFRQAQHDDIETNESGLIMKDAAFGTAADDAFRRDFTINALYYDVESHEIIDYVGGIEDIVNKRLRFIGDPADRLAEDPVRMLRAIRFAAKLGFRIDDDIMALVDDTAERLDAIPGARLFDEFLKLFLSGYGEAAWELLSSTPLARSLFPSCDPNSKIVSAAMRNTDQRIAADQPVTPGYLIAVLLWADFAARSRESNPENKAGLVYDIATDTLALQQQHIAIPRRFSTFAREVWQLQPRLIARQPKNVRRVLTHKRFRAAFDFLCLRGLEDDNLADLGRWWATLQTLEREDQQAMIDALPTTGKRRRSRRKRGGNRQSGNAQQEL
ncbi:MAG: polynucleotide adenylyltransferase PcnB [bacterium]